MAMVTELIKGTYQVQFINTRAPSLTERLAEKADLLFEKISLQYEDLADQMDNLLDKIDHKLNETDKYGLSALDYMGIAISIIVYGGLALLPFYLGGKSEKAEVKEDKEKKPSTPHRVEIELPNKKDERALWPKKPNLPGVIPPQWLKI